MEKAWDGIVSIIDRPGGADSAVLHDLAGRVRVERLLPEQIEALNPETEAILIRGGFWSDLEKLADLAPALKWIHVNMAGVEHLDTSVLKERGIVLTNASGVLDRGIAEFVLGATLLWAKGLHRSVLETQSGIWNPREPKAHASLRALVIGAGGIGAQCASLFQAAGFAFVAGVRRSSKPLPDVFDEQVSFDDLSSVIGSFDVVVSCVPATPETDNLLSADVLVSLKDDMVLINVGRGNVIDHVALARVLEQREDMLAVLDVTEPEPLPESHPLRDCSNVVLSPHMAGETVERHDHFSTLFCENLQNYIQGTPMTNVIV